jgi:hypothetical protein
VDNIVVSLGDHNRKAIVWGGVLMREEMNGLILAVRLTA